MARGAGTRDLRRDGPQMAPGESGIVGTTRQPLYLPAPFPILMASAEDRAVSQTCCGTDVIEEVLGR